MKKSLFTPAQIAQALMINYQSELVSNIDRERSPAHFTVQQLFVLRGETRMSRLHMVYLPKDGELMQYDLAPLRIHNSVSNVLAYRNRLQYIQVSMDNKAVVNDDNRKIVRNSNPFKFDELMASKKTSANGNVFNNPYNSAIVTGLLRLAPIPAVHADPKVIAQYNQCSAKIRQVHAALKADADTKGIDLASNTAYRKVMEQLYAQYQANMTALIESGVLALSQVISVADNSLVPALTCDSEMEVENPFFNSVGALQNDISYMPVINEFFGYARVDSDAKADNLNGDLATGLRTLGKDDDTTEESISRAKRQEATRLAYVSDTFGNESSILLRRQDQGYVNPRNPNQSGLAEIFDSATQNNESVFFRGKYLPVVATKDVGGNANGILRGTVVLNEFTRHRSLSVMASIEGSLSSVDDLNLDNVDEFLSKEVNFTADSLQTDVDVDTSLAGLPSDELQEKTAEKAPAQAPKGGRNII